MPNFAGKHLPFTPNPTGVVTLVNEVVYEVVFIIWLRSEFLEDIAPISWYWNQICFVKYLAWWGL